MATMTKNSMGVDGSSSSSRKDKGKAIMVEETHKAVNNNGNVNVEKLTLGTPATGNVKSLSNKVDGKGLELEESLKKLTLESSEIKEEEEVVEKKFLTLKTSDGETFKVEEDVILQSETIKILVEDGCGGDEIPLVNVTGNILTMVIEYCKHHVGDKKYGKEAEELTDWNDKFIDVDQKTVFNIILAANYLNIKGLLDLSCEKAAKMISGKPVPEIRRILGIKNHGFTEEEEEENRKWSPWAYED